MPPRMSEWRKLPLSLAELCIDTTLRCGQSFRWRKIDDEWHCALHGRIVSLRQDHTHLHYRVTWPDAPGASVTGLGGPLTPSPSLASEGEVKVKQESALLPNGQEAAVAAAKEEDVVDDDTLALLHGYFNLFHSLTALYTQWSAADAHFARITSLSSNPTSPAPIGVPNGENGKTGEPGPGRFAGVRILNQDAWEALICFVCSSNNNIARIAQMVHRLCTEYGPYLGTIAGEAFHDFPSAEALAAADELGHRLSHRASSSSGNSGTKKGEADNREGGEGVEDRLRALGFGYRARYIAETARLVAREKPPGWLLGLRNPAAEPPWPPNPSLSYRSDTPEIKPEVTGSPPETPSESPKSTPPATYRDAHTALLSLSGVGPKVADCVCLMGLGWGEAVPVDTHVWQIAVRDYGFGRRSRSGKTLSKAAYDAVGDHFRALWGPQAGWAHSVLFTADLKAFASEMLPASSSSSSSAASPPPRRAKAVTETVKRERSVREEEEADGEAIKTTITRTRSARSTRVLIDPGCDGDAKVAPSQNRKRKQSLDATPAAAPADLTAEATITQSTSKRIKRRQEKNNNGVVSTGTPVRDIAASTTTTTSTSRRLRARVSAVRA